MNKEELWKEIDTIHADIGRHFQQVYRISRHSNKYEQWKELEEDFRYTSLKRIGHIDGLQSIISRLDFPELATAKEEK